MSVSTTFAFTDSATPRRLISATSTRNASAIAVATGCAASPSGSSRAKAFSTFSDRKIALVDAEVMPEESTAKVTMKVRKRSEEHTSELQSRFDLVCRLLLEKKKKKMQRDITGRDMQT